MGLSHRGLVLEGAAQSADKAAVGSLILAALFALIENTTISSVELAGAGIREPKNILWAFAILAAVQYYRFILAFSLPERNFTKLWDLDEKERKPNVLAGDEPMSGELRLSTPPSILRLAVVPVHGMKDINEDSECYEQALGLAPTWEAVRCQKAGPLARLVAIECAIKC